MQREREIDPCHIRICPLLGEGTSSYVATTTGTSSRTSPMSQNERCTIVMLIEDFINAPLGPLPNHLCEQALLAKDFMVSIVNFELAAADDRHVAVHILILMVKLI